jgi:S-disulfanyl-L-cysteine oxidoreductase SoxD
MFKLANLNIKTVILVFLIACCANNIVAQTRFPNIGRQATKDEVEAWDIDVRPDFKGLPKGSGTTARGQEVWEGRCASCHGTFGESNEVFTPIVGGTTQDDIKTGRVASLTSQKQPQRTTLMKVATVSTLWDYIHRAMPWNAPRTLSNDDTFAVLAYLLSMAEIVPEDFTLSDSNIADVQKLMPNRNGMTQSHGLWNEGGKPDLKATACMSDCSKHVVIGSFLPDYARNAHDNLALQNRPYGPFRGVDTTQPPLAKLPGKNGITNIAVNADSVTPAGLFKKNNCSTCHAPASRAIGPAISEIAAKYKDQVGALAQLQRKVKVGGSGNWGSIPMPPHAHVSDAEIEVLVKWILTGK